MKKTTFLSIAVILLILFTWTTVASAASVLKYGSRGQEVVKIQQQLIKLGYLKGSADGIYGSMTQSAVKAFQKDKGLKVDGICGPQTQAALNASAGSSGNNTPAPEPDTTALKEGSRGAEVKAMQKRLNELGYNCGTADGIFGAKTKAAVIAFQKAKGLTANGIADKKTLDALYDSSAPKPDTTTLKEGSRGEAVKAMQKRLNELGYNCGTADGIFGAKTKAAVIAFQKAKGLTANGIADKKTLDALYSNSTEPEEPEEPKEPEDPPSEKPVAPITSTLRLGSRGPEVVALQKRLNELGYNCGTADGIFGTKTEQSVKAFQKAQGLTADGIVGPQTIRKLFPDATYPTDPEPGSFTQRHGTPGALTGKTIILDAGHGGSDSGAYYGDAREKYMTLDIAKRLKRILEEAGATVLMTRTDDSYLSLFYRSAFVNTYVLNKELERLNGIQEGLDKDFNEAQQSKSAKESQRQQAFGTILPLLPEWKGPVDWSKADEVVQYLQEKRPVFASRYAQAQKAYDDQKGAHDSLSAQLESLNGQLTQLEKDKQALEALQRQKADLEDAIETLNRDIANLQKEYGSLSAQLEATPEDSPEYAELYEAWEDKKAELDDKKALRDQKQEELDAIPTDIEDQIAQCDGQIKGLKDQIADIDIESSQQAVEQSKNVMDQRKTELDLLDQVIRLTGEITDLNTRIQDMQETIAENMEAIADIEGKIAKFKPYLQNPGNDNRGGIYAFVPGTNYANAELKEVFEITKNYQDDILYISIHINSTGHGTQYSASGSQVYYLDYSSPASWEGYYYPNYYTGYDGAKRQRLASKLLSGINAATPFAKKASSPQRKDFSILRESNLVSALVEVAYMNNPDDLYKLQQEQTREDAAKGLYDGIVAYYR